KHPMQSKSWPWPRRLIPVSLRHTLIVIRISLISRACSLSSDLVWRICCRMLLPRLGTNLLSTQDTDLQKGRHNSMPKRWQSTEREGLGSGLRLLVILSTIVVTLLTLASVVMLLGNGCMRMRPNTGSNFRWATNLGISRQAKPEVVLPSRRGW